MASGFGMYSGEFSFSLSTIHEELMLTTAETLDHTSQTTIAHLVLACLSIKIEDATTKEEIITGIITREGTIEFINSFYVSI